jgi:hypothetical protein
LNRFSIIHFYLDKSSVSRQIYAVHVIETHNSVYCKENW